MSNLFWLDKIRPSHYSQVGNKAFHLSHLLQRGYPVIPGVVISSQVLRQFLETIDWLEPLFADLPHSSLRLDIENPRQLQAIAQQMRQAIVAAPLPDSLEQELTEITTQLRSPTLILRPSLAVQVEAGGAGNRTLAALHSSALFNAQVCRANAAEFVSSLKQLWAELFGAKSLFFWQRSGIPLQQVRLAVLVQSIGEAIAAGTSRMNGDQCLVLATPGLGMAIARGEVVPDFYQVDTTRGVVQTQRIGNKTIGYTIASASTRTQEPSSLAVANATLPVLPEVSLDRVRPRSTPEQFSPEQSVVDRPTIERSRYLSAPAIHSPLQIQLLSVDQQHTFTLDRPTLDRIAHLTQQATTELGGSLELKWLLTADRPTVEGATVGDTTIRLYLTQVTPWPTSDQMLVERLVNPVPAARASTNPSSPSHSGLPGLVDRANPLKDPSGHLGTNLGANSDRPRPASPNHALSDTTQPRRIVGFAAAPGQAIAHAKILRSSEPPDRLPPGTVLVAPTIPPTWLPLIRQCAAIVSEQGGMTSHGAIVARELGVPAVVGVAHATDIIQPDELVLVNGTQGYVQRLIELSGLEPELLARGTDRPLDPSLPDRPVAYPPLGTHLMVNLSQPDSLTRLAALPIDGIGLLRSELLAMSVLEAQHPLHWLRTGRAPELVKRLADAVHTFAQTVTPRPVFYRSLDLRSHEFPDTLAPLDDRDTPAHPMETNPMLGVRGTFRYTLYPELFDRELEALAQVRRAGDRNVHLLLPFVRTVEEFRFCRQRIAQAGLLDDPQFQLWIMAEVPSVLFLLPEYVQAGVQGISIGSNDLTQLLLGADRDHPALATALDANHPAVLAAMSQLIRQARELGIPCCICGQAPVQHPELIDRLVEWGITAISVEPEFVQSTYRAIAQAERRLVLKAAQHQIHPSL